MSRNRLNLLKKGVICALQYAKAIEPGHVQAIYVDFDEEATAKLREKWQRRGAGAEKERRWDNSSVPPKVSGGSQALIIPACYRRQY